jgi:hypothetical protein
MMKPAPIQLLAEKDQQLRQKHHNRQTFAPAAIECVLTAAGIEKGHE